MTRVLGVHGVGNYRYFRAHGTAPAAAEALAADWAAALYGDSGGPLDMAYYAHLLHRGTAQGPTDVTLLEPGEQELFVNWVELMLEEPQTAQGRATTKIRQAGDWLTRNHPELPTWLATTFIREVNTYLHLDDDSFRNAARESVAEAIRTNRPNVLIAHSLGSVVAYESLVANRDLHVETFITLGSPLGMNKIVFQRLRPFTKAERRDRPPNVARWINAADIGDLVALPLDLRTRFTGLSHTDLEIGRFDFHTAKGYLASANTRRLLA